MRTTETLTRVLCPAVTLLAIAIALIPGEAHAQRQPFIDHLISFRSLLFGPYGDEGERVAGELDQMAAALSAWDDSLRAQELTLRTTRPAPGSRVEDRSALAALFASRGRFGAALFEIEAALAAEPKRRQLYTWRGRLLGALRREAEAAAAYRRAWDLDRSDAVNAYLAVSIPSSSDTAESSTAPITALLDAQRRGFPLARDRYGAEPIRSVQLIPDRASKTPVFAPVLYAPGFDAIAAGNYAAALARFRAATLRDPLVIDRALRSQPMATAIASLRAGRIADAIAPLEAATSTHGNSSEVHRILGTAYGATGNTAKAVEHLTRAVSLAPGDERTRLAHARALRDAGRPGEAAQSLREALAVMPRSAEARWMLGEVLEQAGSGVDAARELELAASATVIAGRSALYWRAAEIYDRHQEFERVVSLLRQRVRLDPNNAAVHRHLGLVYSRLGQPEEAFAELVMADLLGGADAESLTAIGQLHLDADRLADAEAVARRAVSMDPDRQDARYVLGRTLLRLGRAVEAREQLDLFQRLRDRAMADQRRNFEIDKLRAEAARQSAAGRHDDVADTWRRIVNLMPDVAGFHVSLAESLVTIGEFEEAATRLEQAAALGAGPAVRLRQAEVYLRLGRRAESEQARRAYEQDVKKLLKMARP